MNIALEYYKIFYYVGKNESISKAAKELCISQPAVSQAIKHLETQLCARLFLRTQKGVQLTSEGMVLYTYIKQGYEYILLGERKFKELLDLDTGEIKVGASDMTLKYYLLPYLEKFHMQYPHIKVSVTNAPTPETLQYLEEGRIDFGIVSTPITEHPNIEIQTVKEIHDIFVAGSRFADLKKQSLSFQALEQYPLICLEKTTSTRSFMDTFLSSKQVLLKPEFELATSDMIVQFVKRNMGIGCVVSDFAEEYMRDGQMFQLHFQESIPSRQICIAVSRKIPVSNAARHLVDMLQAETSK